jgi:hypothetical protein
MTATMRRSFYTALLLAFSAAAAVGQAPKLCAST